MGNITNTSVAADRASETLARIGAKLGCQRVELYAIAEHDQATLVEHWEPWTPGVRVVITGPTEVPLEWFPWSLGNLRPEEYVFIRNAASLPLSGRGLTIGDVGMASALHLPLMGGRWVLGAVCAYWSEECVSWPTESRSVVCSWAAEALSLRPGT